MKLLTDEQLILQMQHGKRAAMEEFYRRYSPYLTAVCRRYVGNAEDVRDVLQESFIKIFASIKRFRLQQNGTLRAWSARIAAHQALNYLRDNRHLLIVSTEELFTEDIPDSDINAEPLPPEVIQQLIIALPTGYRTIFNLFAIEGLSHKEISKLLGISESTSASQYHRAKTLLKKRIQHYLAENH